MNTRRPVLAPWLIENSLDICLPKNYSHSIIDAMRKNPPTRDRGVHFGVVCGIAAESTQPREPARALRPSGSIVSWMQLETQSLSFPDAQWPARASHDLNWRLGVGHECPEASAGYAEPSLATIAAHIPHLTTTVAPVEPRKSCSTTTGHRHELGVTLFQLISRARCGSVGTSLRQVSGPLNSAG